MDVFNDFATDEKKEVDGVWQEIGPEAEILVARAGNKKYSRMLSAAYEKHARVLDLKTESSEALSESIMIDVMAETVLLGWRGEKLKFKGRVLPVSVENAKLFLGVKDFRSLVSRLSSAHEQYRVAQEEALGKN